MAVKITDISLQAKNKDRVNVSIDGKYAFSLDVYQVGELGVRIGKEYTEENLAELLDESQFGKTYARALEYCLMRPHSSKEVKDYLWRKTRPSLRKDGSKREGISQAIADRVYDRLKDKGYINDDAFARYWVEHRNQTKGSSKRKLMNELRVKGVALGSIEQAFEQSSRNDEDELQKILNKKRSKYDSEEKLLNYLARQGFSYGDIRTALDVTHEGE
ncbi:MAG TPA: RecX family transcriptional regulator [Candidatus Saccharibacteria bacterium]|nr:RecX family transcriptional regulator [Candidatus Saccharibacteria bacterium]